MSYKPTLKSFLGDVKNHTMRVIRDDGLYRHVRFKNPDTTIFYFDLITWPGHLCYTGDMGTYVFERLEDMFQFFRRSGESYSIDMRYWAEKVQASDKSDGIKEFSPELFKEAVHEYRLRWVRGYRDQLTKEQRRELWEAVDSDVLASLDEGQHRACNAVYDFSYKVEGRTFWFNDFFERTIDDYTFRFVWCCFALAWGIQQYDTAKQEASTA